MLMGYPDKCGNHDRRFNPLSNNENFIVSFSATSDMRPRVFSNSLYFVENLIANFKFIEITAFIWIPH